MAKRIAEAVVLAEDSRQGNFARRYLIARGQDPRTIYTERAPLGQGSGEQYVREHYPAEVAYHRNRSSRRSGALIVVTDADARTVARREQELKRELESAGEAGRRPSEAIVLLIPKRNIETWILCLSGRSVDESTDYKGSEDLGKWIKLAAQNFHDWSRSFSVPNHCVPSLQRGLEEVKRLP